MPAFDSSNKTLATYGTWPSPIDAHKVAHSAPRIADCRLHNGQSYWCESIASEGGRNGLMRSNGQEEGTNILPHPYNIRSKVHEYGGAAYCLTKDYAYFVNAADQCVYRLNLNTAAESTRHQSPEQITQTNNKRFADLIWDAKRERLIAVCEEHLSEKHEVKNTIVAITLEGKIIQLVEGADFYAYPRIDPKGSQLCWISWMHPNMPWDSTQLHIAEFDNSGHLTPTFTLGAASKSSSKEKTNESIVQPTWSPEGELYYVSDKNNWWNIYKLTSTSGNVAVEQVTNLSAEFATPLWVFGMQNLAFINQQTLAASYTQNGRWYLCRINLKDKTLSSYEQSFSSLESLDSEAGKLLYISSSPNTSSTVHLSHDANDLEQTSTLNASNSNINEDDISHAEAIEFKTSHNETAHAFYYPPCNARYKSDGPAPVIVLSHGGPTGQTNDALNYKIQYWTNRGFSVVDINYRGSTGYGRDYRQALYKNWGLHDVADMQAAVTFLAERGDINPNMSIIKGSSAGGYTVLAALTFTDTFKAGVSLYGIGDLELLATDTHKFEAHYLDQLIGPYPENKALYQSRSPIHFVDKLSCPLLLFQGLEDCVVPPNQAREMAESVKQKGLPVALVEYINEGHGFRAAETIEHMLNAELYFYQSVFKLKPHQSTLSNPIVIENSENL